MDMETSNVETLGEVREKHTLLRVFYEHEDRFARAAQLL